MYVESGKDLKSSHLLRIYDDMIMTCTTCCNFTSTPVPQAFSDFTVMCYCRYLILKYWCCDTHNWAFCWQALKLVPSHIDFNKERFILNVKIVHLSLHAHISIPLFVCSLNHLLRIMSFHSSSWDLRSNRGERYADWPLTFRQRLPKVSTDMLNIEFIYIKQALIAMSFTNRLKMLNHCQFGNEFVVLHNNH